LQGTKTLLWPCIDIDLPIAKESSENTGGGNARRGAGCVSRKRRRRPSRKYSEMRLDNFKGAGDVIRQLKLC
jgi:hypothetical protein